MCEKLMYVLVGLWERGKMEANMSSAVSWLWSSIAINLRRWALGILLLTTLSTGVLLGMIIDRYWFKLQEDALWHGLAMGLTAVIMFIFMSGHMLLISTRTRVDCKARQWLSGARDRFVRRGLVLVCAGMTMFTILAEKGLELSTSPFQKAGAIIALCASLVLLLRSLDWQQHT